MNHPELYLAGKPLAVVKRIGKGGEGEVFLVAGALKKAVKVYTGNRDPEREAKVKAMVQVGLAKTSSLVSFPEDVVVNRSGEFAGFTMKLVEGYRPVHELYGPKSRKLLYPKADYRFLVRVAANIARAVAQVHSQPCVIGDVNHSGILVSEEATVALIDADSFQFQRDGRTYRCLVGVPDFTPPELQGQSLAGVVRTKAHDHFGLAIAIFQLLLMGRHPYAGRQQHSDLALNQLIAQNLFAYSKARNLPIAPPGVTATLDDFPAEVANAFDHAFGLHPQRRPTASEWVKLLQNLEGRLSRCSSNRAHFYPSSAATCPWCRMEASSGAILFLPPFISTVNGPMNLIGFSVEKAWLAINAVAIPHTLSVIPKLPLLPITPSEKAKKAKGKDGEKAVAVAIALIAIGGFVVIPKLAMLWIVGLISAVGFFNKSGIDPKPWTTQYGEIDRRCEEAIERWRNSLGIEQLLEFKSNLENAVSEYRGLGPAKTAAISRLKAERERRQRHEFLDRFLIRANSISGIGTAKTMTLASFGIESAADITGHAITSIPGFGSATAMKLLAWRASHERRFIYNPVAVPADAQAEAGIEAQYAAKARTLAAKISGGQTEITQIGQKLYAALNSEDSGVSALVVQREQLRIDLKFLGISLPAKSTSNRPTRPIAQRTHVNASSKIASGNQSVGLKCPRCGSPMVSRMARRGGRAGNRFWGCSRYPTCRGTRN